jgi:hypothetical protein
MKKVIFVLLAVAGFSAASFAQTSQAKKTDPSKMQVATKSIPNKIQPKVVPVTKITAATPVAAKSITKTPVVKPENNRAAVKATPAVKPNNTVAMLKKDGTPDKRFSANKHLKSDGTPDMRYKNNKAHN